MTTENTAPTAEELLDDPTALQRIVNTEEQARAMLSDIEDLDRAPDRRWEFKFAVTVDDLPVIEDELEALLPDDDRE